MEEALERIKDIKQKTVSKCLNLLVKIDQVRLIEMDVVQMIEYLCLVYLLVQKSRHLLHPQLQPHQQPHQQALQQDEDLVTHPSKGYR